MHFFVSMLNVVSIVSAFVAAKLWYESAKVNLPDKFTIFSEHYTSDNPEGAQIFAEANSPELNSLGNALIEQSKLSAYAARAAAVAAVTQGLVWLASVML